HLGRLLLHPVAGERDVLDLDRPGDERLHADRQLLAERDVLLAPDEQRGRGDPGPVLEPLAQALDRSLAVQEPAQPSRPQRARLGTAEGGAVVVDTGAQRTGLAGRRAEAQEVLLGERVLAHRRAADAGGDRAPAGEAGEPLRAPSE